LNIGLKKSDKHHLHKFKEYIKCDRDIINDYISELNGKKFKYSSIEITSKKMVTDLFSHGIVPNKSLILEAPDDLPIDLKRHFWRGVWDGDGSIFCYKGQWAVKLSSGSRIFLNQSKEYINRAINDYRGDIPSKTTNKFDLRFSGNNLAWKAGKLLYRNASIYLDRKYEKYLEMHQQLGVDKIIVYYMCSKKKCTKVAKIKGKCVNHYKLDWKRKKNANKCNSSG
jgi:hypothetical protein